MKRFSLSVVAGALILGTWGMAQADPIAQATRLDMSAQGQVAGANRGYSDATSSWNRIYHDMDETCSAASIASSGSSINFFGSGTVHFDSSSQGSVSFSDAGFTRVIFNQNDSAWASLSDSFWSYTFLNQGATKLVIHCDSNLGDSSTDAEGLQGFAATVFQGDQGDESTPIYYNEMDLGDAGKFKVYLDPGEIYTVKITLRADLNVGFGFGFSTMDANFDWKIVPVKK